MDQYAVFWEWLTFEHLDPDIDIIGPLHPRDRWTNLNASHVMPDGNWSEVLRAGPATETQPPWRPLSPRRKRIGSPMIA